MRIKKLFGVFCAILFAGMTLCLSACGGGSAKTIEMGLYPQSVVSSGLATNLNQLITSNPYDDLTWKEFNNGVRSVCEPFGSNVISVETATRINASSQDRSVLYKDFEYMGVKYRCIFKGANEDSYNVQSGAIFYKYEPIKWKVLKEDKENGKKLLASVNGLDSCGNYAWKAYEFLFQDGKANNYERSYIRQFLNDEFYNFAFSEEEKAMILTTTIDNSTLTMKDADEALVCANTEDKIFLPSYKELNDSQLGFKDNNSRIVYATSYAKMSSTKTGPNDYYNSYITRSPEIYNNGGILWNAFTSINLKGEFEAENAVGSTTKDAGMHIITPWMWVSSGK